MSNLALPSLSSPNEATVATKAVLRAAERLGVPNRALAKIIGLSEASVSRMGKGGFTLRREDKAFELGLLFVRVFRSLDAITGGDEPAARAWLRNENVALGGTPLALMNTVSGLVDVLAYLDARRARA